MPLVSEFFMTILKYCIYQQKCLNRKLLATIKPPKNSTFNVEKATGTEHVRKHSLKLVVKNCNKVRAFVFSINFSLLKIFRL